MFGEHMHILTSLTQGGQSQTDHIQTVKQVFAEHAFFDALLQILVGGRNDPHIGFNGTVAADAVKMAIGQNTQQTRLQIKGHVANFVQEQSAALGLLKTTTARRLRTREGTSLMAKEFAFQQVFGNGRCVDGHKRTIGAGGMLVQCTRHQLFARTRLAGDHDGDIALRQAPNGAKHILHGRRLAQHFRCGCHQLFGHLFALAFFQGSANQLNGFGQIKGFGQIFKGTALKCGDGTVQVGKRRHDDDGQTRQALLHFCQQIQTRTTRHANVADQHLRPFAAFIRVQRGQDLARVGKAACGQTLAQQSLL